MDRKLKELSIVLRELSELIDDIRVDIMASKVKQESEQILTNTEGCKKVREILKEIGFRPNLRGYNYVITAMEQLSTQGNNQVLDVITKVLYPNIAKVHGATSSRVERAIRHSIEISYILYPEKYLLELGINKQPTNKEFICALLERLGD